MREFRIKVNNEKTYVVKANDYNQAVKTLHSKLRDNTVSDSISRYTGEDAIRTNGFVKIKEDGDWTSYKYNGSNFDDAVFKIHQYNPSLIAFVSNGNRTITVRNKYLNDADYTAQGEIEVLKSFGFDYKDGKWVKESNNNTIVAQPDYHYVSVIGPGDTEKHCKKYQYQSAGMLKKIIASNIKDSSIKDVSYVSGKNLKIGQKIVEDGEVLEVVDIKETQRGVNNNYRDVTLKNVKTGATETVHFVNSALARLNDYSIKDSDSYQVWTINEKGVYHKEADVPNPQLAKAIASQLKKQGRWVQISKNSRTNIVSDCDMMDSLSIKVKLNGKTYNGIFNGISNTDKTFGDVYIPELVSLHSGDRGVFNEDEGRYVSDGKFYFKLDNLKRWNPSLNNYLTDSDRYNKGQKIQTSAGIHEIIGYDPVKADVHTNRIEYSYRLKTPNGTYTNMPDWQLEELVKQGRYKLIDSNISDKLIESGSKKALSKNIATEIKAGKDPKQAAAIAYSVQRENDASTGYKYRITNNGSKWYYETTFPDGHTTLTGPYSSKQETEQYFHKHRPTEKLTDADPVKVEKIIRKEKSALGVTYYIFQTKSSSGYTIYYQVTDKTYHGEPTYSGGGIISFSLKSANDTLDHKLLADKLKAKYGEKEGTKRYLRGENDSAIKDSNNIKNRISYDDLKRTINMVMEEGNDKDIVNILIGQLAELKKDYEKDINNSKLDKEETKQHYNEYKRLVNNYKNSQISKEYTKAVNSFLSAIKDSANITELTKKAKQLKNKLKKEKAHSYENWGQAEIRQLKDLFDYNNYSQSTKIINEFINWVDERTPGKIGDSNPNNIKNRKSYTIKVGDKQYKVFAESESEAINKYIKSKK